MPDKCVFCMALLRPCLAVSQVDKHAIVAELGIHYRDLRILDPLVSFLIALDTSVTLLNWFACHQ